MQNNSVRETSFFNEETVLNLVKCERLQYAQLALNPHINPTDQCRYAAKRDACREIERALKKLIDHKPMTLADLAG